MIHSIFLLSPIFVCLFWALLFFRSKTHAKDSKNLFGAFMLISAFRFISHIAYFSYDSLFYKYFDDIYLFSTLLIFPTYYLYIVSLTHEKILKKKYLIHFAPAFIFLIGYIILSTLLSTDEYETYLTSFIHSKKLISIDLTYPIHRLGLWMILSRVFYIIQILFYVVLGLKLWLKWKQRIQDSLSEIEGKEINQIVFYSILGIALAIIAILIDSYGRIFVSSDSIILLIPAFLFSFFFFIIGTLAYDMKFSISDLEDIEKSAEKSQISNPISQINNIRKGLELLMEEKNIFLIQDLKITTVCEKLHTNRTYLSQVLNEELKENFNSYINKHRVNYAISLLQDPSYSKYSLEKFSELSGFGSTISMNRAFKNTTGKTPSSFRI